MSRGGESKLRRWATDLTLVRDVLVVEVVAAHGATAAVATVAFHQDQVAPKRTGLPGTAARTRSCRGAISPPVFEASKPT